jgi:phosphoribosylanthranilate isomerase
MMFRIKICGITSVEDGCAVVAAGADALGLNFYEKSPRYVSAEVAEQIVATLPPGVKKVGVFVNATAEEIRARFSALSLDLIQLHGDERPEFLAELDGLPVMRAFRAAGNLSAVGDYLHQCEQLNCRPKMVLIDAYRKGQYGGTGETVDWTATKAGRPQIGTLSMVLAGGLTPQNVGQAIAAVEPDAVDTASGVEVSPGHKSAELIRAFVTEAQRAFDLLGRSR